MTFHHYGARAVPGLPGLAAELHFVQSAAGQALPQRLIARVARTARDFDRQPPAAPDPARFELSVRSLPLVRRRQRVAQAA